jgi:predicted dehydrogenase
MSKLKMGALGASGHLLTRIMLPLSQSEEVELIALASRNKEKAEKEALKWNIPKIYGSYEALLEDAEIEAVYIPLPNHMHLEWMKKAIDAKKHVLCEKPFTLDAKETDELIAYAKDKGVKIMEAFMYRFHPKWKKVQELMKVSGIGEVQTIHTIFSYNNQDENNIRNIKEYGGGALMDIGCYAINSARYILGQDPVSVVSKISYSDAFGTDILSSAILDFGKTRVLFTVGTAMYPMQEVKIYGTGGSIEVVIPFNDLDDIKGKIIVTTSLGQRVLEFEPTNQYGEMLDAFAKAVKDDIDVPLSLEDSRMNMHIIDQLVKSGKSNQWESI